MKKIINAFWSLPLFKGSKGKPDLWFVGGFVVLCVFGLIMLSSASNVVAYSRFGTPYYFFIHQLFSGFLPGVVVLYLASKIDYHIWKKFALPLFITAMVLLAVVLIPGLGLSAKGASRWIVLGPISIQPAEIAKLALILYLAAWFDKRSDKEVKDFVYGFIIFAVIVVAMALLIIAQPDLGTVSVIGIIAFVMYFVAGASMGHILLAIGGAFSTLAVLIKIKPHAFQRFTVFLHPEYDPLGIGYHINQALLAIGSGGVFGRGFGHSRQKFNYLPEVFGDSIFAVIAEELGMVFSVLLISLYAFLAFRMMRIARLAPDKFGKYIATGVMTWITYQALVNIGAMLSIIPLTGVTLPFVSYGGSSLLTLMAGVGILLNISRQSKQPS